TKYVLLTALFCVVSLRYFLRACFSSPPPPRLPLKLQFSFFDGPKNIVDRQHLIDSPSANCLSVHAKNHGRSLVLSDHVTAGIFHRLDASHSIISHSGKDHSDGHRPRVGRSALQSQVCTWAISQDSRPVIEHDPTCRRDAHVMGSWTHIHSSRNENLAGLGFFRANRACLRQLLAELRSEIAGHVLHDDHCSRKLAREQRKEFHQR